MLDRVSVSIALATILAVLGKLAFLYAQANESWFQDRVDQEVLYLILISVFLVFLRGKMMHDDSPFFTAIEKKEAFKDDPHSKARIKSGLMIGYLSWLCWAPAVYFLQTPSALGWWLSASLGLSTLWLITDVATRKDPNETESRKRLVFLVFNVFYVGALVAMATKALNPAGAAAALVLILIIDWLMSDTLSAHV